MLIHTDINAANLSFFSGVQNDCIYMRFAAFTVDSYSDDGDRMVKMHVHTALCLHFYSVVSVIYYSCMWKEIHHC
jgi:hypothetical protein